MSVVESVNGKTGVVTLKAAEVEAVPESSVGAANGVASLNSSAQLPEGELPSSVLTSASAAKGRVPMSTGSGAYAWEQGLKSVVDIRELIEGVTQNAVIGSALNTALGSLPPGAEVFFPPLPEPVTFTGAGTLPYQKATIYKLDTAVQLQGEIGLCGPGPGNGRVVLRCETGFSDSQMVRNWLSTDWQAGRTDTGCKVTKGSATVEDPNIKKSDEGKLVRDARASTAAGLGYPFGIGRAWFVGTVNEAAKTFQLVNATKEEETYQCATGTIELLIGEPDHTIAPYTTATPLYYPRVHDLGFDIFGATGVTCIGRVHPQEQASIMRVTYWNTAGGSSSGCYGRADFGNADSAGTIAGSQINDGEISYGKGWASMILQDSTCGGKVAPTYSAGGDGARGIVTPSVQLATEDFSSSPLKFIAIGDINLADVHQEAAPTQEGPTIAVTDASVTEGSTTLTTAGSVYFCGHHVGRSVEGEGIPAGTIITKYLSKTTLEMSAPATATHATITATIGPDESWIRLLDCPGANLKEPLATPHFELKRPWVRSTASGFAPSSASITSPLITGTRLAASGTSAWESGASIIEDYPGDGLFRRLQKSSTFDPRQIIRYDGDELVWADGETALIKQAKLHPRQVPDNELWTPARQGLIAANGDPGQIAASANLTIANGVMTLAWISTPWNFRLSTVWWVKASVGEITEAESAIGLYSVAGKLLASTGPLSKTAWEASSHAVKVAQWLSLGAPIPKSGTGVWMAFLKNGSGTLTLASMGITGSANLGLGSESQYARSGTYGTGLKALPSEITPASITPTTGLAWAGLS
jgi:hypothetical protein